MKKISKIITLLILDGLINLYTIGIIFLKNYFYIKKNYKY